MEEIVEDIKSEEKEHRENKDTNKEWHPFASSY